MLLKESPPPSPHAWDQLDYLIGKLPSCSIYSTKAHQASCGLAYEMLRIGPSLALEMVVAQQRRKIAKVGMCAK